MAFANLLNTSTPNFIELIGNGKVYRVPMFQRDYSWAQEQWEDLWQDIDALRASNEHRHYMGALVLEAISDREFSIIDGQQRIATLSILALVIIERLLELVNENADADDNKQRAEQLTARFIGEKDAVSLTHSSKLHLNQVDDDFYQDYLVARREPPNPKRLAQSNQALLECRKYFRRCITQDSALCHSGKELAKLLNETVARQLLFIQITVDDDINAYTVFETLNARGLELSATDLLKNFLFSKVRGQPDLEALGRRWKRLVTTVRQDLFPEFLRYHLLCAEPKIRQQRLFKVLRDRIHTDRDVFALIDDLEPRAELFAAMSDPEHAYWNELTSAAPWIRELNLFRVRQCMPALFAAGQKWGRGEKFVGLLRMLAIFSFRYTIIGGLNPNDLEPAYHAVAKGILDGRFHGANDAIGALTHLYPSDDKFQRDFAEASFVDRGAGAKLTRYILIKLENHVAGKNRDWKTDPATIEHVLPQNAQGDWEENFPDEQQALYCARLGNLTLLERSLNRDVGTVEFSEKLKGYARSAYQLTHKLAEHAGDEWSPAAIQARQRRLAALAVAVWRVP